MLFSTRRGGVSDGPVRVAQPRPPDGRRRRQRRREPRAARRGGRPPARALPLRPPGPRRRRCAARPSRPAPARPRRRGGRPGDRARRRAGARVRRRLPAGAARRRRRRRGAARRLARARRRDRRRGRRRAARARRDGRDRPPRSGPGARGCCYEVGEEVHAAFADVPGARAGERNLDLPAIARHRLRAGRRRARSTTPGCARSAPATSCSSPTAATAASPAARRGSCGGHERRTRVRANAERVRAEIAAAARRAGRDPADVELLAAVKYVAARGHRRARRGRPHAARREPRAGARGEARRAPATLRWHFIGQLQSRKVKQILPLVELIHSVASDSALRAARAPRAAGDRDPGRGQRRAARRARPGSHPDELPAFLERAPVRVVGLMTMPPFAERSGGRAGRTSPRCASSPPSTACAQLSMGTSQDYAVAVEEGATIVRVGSVLFE